MHKILIIARREYLATVRTKAFIFGLILVPILMGGGGITMALMNKFASVKDKKIVVVDRSGEMAKVITDAAKTRNAMISVDKKSGRKSISAFIIDIEEPDKINPDAQRLQLSDSVRNNWINAFVEIGPDIAKNGLERKDARIAYYSKNPVMDEMSGWIGATINNELRRIRMVRAGVDESRINEIFQWQSVENMNLVGRDAKTGKIENAKRQNELQAAMTPVVIAALMLMIVVMGAMPLLHSIMDEKTQRIAEILLGSVRPFDLMLGKLLGGLGVSLTGSFVYLAFGAGLLNYFNLTQYIPYALLPWFFTFAIFDIFMLGSMLLALGSACNDPKDAQAMVMPAMLQIMIPMFVIGPVLKEPSSAFATWMSLIPPFTPILMLFRMATPVGVPIWQTGLGLLGVLIFTLFVVWVGGRIFRIGLLMQGKTPGVKDLIRWAVKG